MSVLGALGLTVASIVWMTPWLGTLVVALVRVSAQGLVWVVRAFASGLDVWTIVTHIGEAVGGVLLMPDVVWLFISAELVGVLALYGLQRVLRGEPAPRPAQIESEQRDIEKRE